MLLYSTLLFVSRECFRKACLSEKGSLSRQTWPAIRNTLWLRF